jgi:hypothetical protein
MASEGELQSPAGRDPVDRGDDGLRRTLDGVDERGEGGGSGRRLFSELADVGPGAEQIAFAREDDGFDVGVAESLLEGPHEMRANGGAEAVHRGVIDEDDAHLFAHV